MEKKELLQLLSKLTQQKQNLESQINTLTAQLNASRDNFLKIVGQIQLLTSILSTIDAEDKAAKKKSKVKEVIPEEEEE